MGPEKPPVLQGKAATDIWDRIHTNSDFKEKVRQSVATIEPFSTRSQRTFVREERRSIKLEGIAWDVYADDCVLGLR